MTTRPGGRLQLRWEASADGARQPNPEGAAGVGRNRYAAGCPMCGSQQTSEFWHADQAPVFCNALCRSVEESRVARQAPIHLRYCEQCSGIFNATFDGRLMAYDAGYENSLHFSPRFQQYAAALADRLVRDHALYDKDLVEIGCGDGLFLRMLCCRGGNRGLGFDPSYRPESTGTFDGLPIRIVPEYFNADASRHRIDFLCCRQVLEHVDAPRDFLQMVRETIGGRRNARLFFEVPNVLFTLEEQGIWDIIYEHCNYFSLPSLKQLFESAGFAVVGLREEFDRQFLSIEAEVAKPGALDLSGDRCEGGLDVPRLARRFAAVYEASVASWREQLETFRRQRARVVLWGAGSKGVTFLNVHRQFQNLISYVVDLNPHKHGRFVPVTGQRVVAPSFLRDFQPDAIVVMNPTYRAEIAAMLLEIDIAAELMVA